jgi:hypothetical protein
MHMPNNMNTPVPDEMGGLDFLADGTVALSDHKANVEFSFQAYGLTFTANTRLIESGPVLQIAADIGCDPYTAEGSDLRDSAHAVIRASHDIPACRLMVSRQKRIYCVGRVQVAAPWTPTTLLAAAAGLILEVRPYLLVLRDILPKWPHAANGSGSALLQ